MQALAALLLLPFLPFALGQYGYDTPADDTTSSSAAGATATSSSSSAGSVQTVNVGQTGLTFSPNTITAAVGSIVEFHFFPPTHSVSQSSFSSPCTNNGTGFFSGAMTTSSGQNSNVFRITINDTNPIWFYCGNPGHCEGGMVGVINTPTDPNKTLDLYTAAAAKVSNTVTPASAQGGVVGPASSGSSTASGAVTSSSSKPSGADTTSGRIYWVGVVLATAVGWGYSILLA